MAERERNNPLLIYLNDDEMRILEERCRMNGRNRSQILRQLIVYGFNYYVDFSNFHNMISELNTIGKNINQIAARVNKTGSIYKNDIDDIKEEMEKLWRSLRYTLSPRLYKKQ